MRRGGHVSGVVSLVMIFCALCLCVFAVLTLSAADRERTLSKLTAERTSAYYEADRAAVEWVASLNGEDYPEGETCTVTIPVGDTQTLTAEVCKQGGKLQITRWQTAYSRDWAPEGNIEVWNGD